VRFFIISILSFFLNFVLKVYFLFIFFNFIICFSISSSYLFLVYRVFLDIPSPLDRVRVILVRFKLANQVVFGLVKSIISIQGDSYNVQFKTQTR